MKMTRERFEQEMVKIRAAVPATHVGPYGPGKPGVRCLVLEVHHRVYGERGAYPGSPGYYWGYQTEEAFALSGLVGYLRAIASRNDAGETWHSIIDSLVPPTAIEASDIMESEELIIEPTPAEIRRGEEPVALPVKRIMDKLGEGART